MDRGAWWATVHGVAKSRTCWTGAAQHIAHTVLDKMLCVGSAVSDALQPWVFPGENTGVDCHFSSRGSFHPEIQSVSPVSPALACGFFATEQPGEMLEKCKPTG